MITPEKSLFILFTAMLFYKLIDLITVTLKLDQSLTRARARALIPFEDDQLELDRQKQLELVQKQLELVRKKIPKHYHWLSLLQPIVKWLHKHRPLMICGTLLITFTWLGAAEIVMDNVDPKARNALIVGIGTFLTSTIASLISMILERYRCALEHL